MGFKYLINANPTCDITIFVKVAQIAQFSFHIFLKKAHTSGMDTDINKMLEAFLPVFNCPSTLQAEPAFPHSPPSSMLFFCQSVSLKNTYMNN